MIVFGIFVVLFTIFNIWYNVYLDIKYKSDGKLVYLFIFHGIWGSLILTFFLVIGEKYINKGPKPIDVYREKTELEIHSINGVPQDTVVVWKGGIEK